MRERCQKDRQPKAQMLLALPRRFEVELPLIAACFVFERCRTKSKVRASIFTNWFSGVPAASVLLLD